MAGRPVPLWMTVTYATRPVGMWLSCRMGLSRHFGYREPICTHLERAAVHAPVVNGRAYPG